MNNITSMSPDVLAVILSFLEWSDIIKLLRTRDSRIIRHFSRRDMFRNVIFDENVDEDRHLEHWLLYGIQGLKEATLRKTLGGAQRVVPALTFQEISKLVIECPLHDGVQKLGMKRLMSPHFAAVRTEAQNLAVPSMSLMFPCLQHLVLRTPVSSLYRTHASEVNTAHYGYQNAYLLDYDALFFGELRSNFLSFELDLSHSLCFFDGQSLQYLPPSLTKLHMESKIGTQKSFSLFLCDIGLVLPNLVDLKISLPFMMTGLDREDSAIASKVYKEGEAPERKVLQPFPDSLTKLSLNIGAKLHYACAALPAYLQTLALATMSCRPNPLLFGFENLFSPLLPQTLTELDFQRVSVMVGTDAGWENRDAVPLLHIRIPNSVSKFYISQGDLSPSLSFRSNAHTLYGLKHLTVYDPSEIDSFRFASLTKFNWDIFPNLVSLNLGTASIKLEQVDNFPPKLVSLHANYDTFSTLAQLVHRLKDCRFGKCRFALYGSDLTAIYKFAQERNREGDKLIEIGDETGEFKKNLSEISTNFPTIQSETDLLIYCHEMLENRVEHCELQFPADRPLNKFAGNFVWIPEQQPLVFPSCTSTMMKFAIFVNPATYRTTRVSLHTQFFNPSLYAFNGLTILVFETRTPLTSSLISALPATLTGFDSKKTPIYDSVLDLSDSPVNLEIFSIGYAPLEDVEATFKKFRKPKLQVLEMPNIMFDPEDLAFAFSASSSVESVEFMCSAQSTDKSLSFLVNEFEGKNVDWQVYGTIFMSGELLPDGIETVDYKILVDSARRKLDPGLVPKHTAHAIWRPAEEITLPSSVLFASFFQKDLLNYSSVNNPSAAGRKTNSEFKTSPQKSPGSKSEALNSSSLASSSFRMGRDSFRAQCPIVYSRKLISLEIQSSVAVDLSSYLLELPLSLTHLSMDVAVVSHPDEDGQQAKRIKNRTVGTESSLPGKKPRVFLAVPPMLTSFVLNNSHPHTMATFDLSVIPGHLESFILKDNCHLMPPLAERWRHAGLRFLKFEGGMPWSDSLALVLQNGLNRSARVEIAIVGFTGVLSNRAARYMDWCTMLQDAQTALPRVRVGVFDLHISSPLALALTAPELQTLKLDPNMLDAPTVIRNEQSTISYMSASRAKKKRMEEQKEKERKEKENASKQEERETKQNDAKFKSENTVDGGGMGDSKGYQSTRNGAENIFGGVNGGEDVNEVILDDDSMSERIMDYSLLDDDEAENVRLVEEYERKEQERLAMEAQTREQEEIEIKNDEKEEEILESENEEEPSFLIHADTFSLLRLPSPLPSTLQELEVSDNNENWPTYRLTSIPNLFITSLVRIVLNVPIRLFEFIGDELPRTLVTLSLPKAEEEPSGTPVAAVRMPPKLMYFSLPNVLLHPRSIESFPASLVLLKVANGADIFRSFQNFSPTRAAALFPNGAPMPTNQRSIVPRPIARVPSAPLRRGAATESWNPPAKMNHSNSSPMRPTPSQPTQNDSRSPASAQTSPINRSNTRPTATSAYYKKTSMVILELSSDEEE